MIRRVLLLSAAFMILPVGYRAGKRGCYVYLMTRFDVSDAIVVAHDPDSALGAP